MMVIQWASIDRRLLVARVEHSVLQQFVMLIIQLVVLDV